jgi:hypothetical protein
VENAPPKEQYMTTREQKTFDPTLKLQVVRMIEDQGQSGQNVSESMASARPLSGAGWSNTESNRVTSPALVSH